jgi:molybdopterin/thiamine biosynthesis adenylyltransferase
MVEVDADGVLDAGCAIGFKGQARVILPTISACYECSVSDSTNWSMPAPNPN